MARRKKTTAPDMPTGVLRQWPDCVQQYRRMIASDGCDPMVWERLSPALREYKEGRLYSLVARAYFHPAYGPHAPGANARELAEVLECDQCLSPLEILESLKDPEHPIRVALAAYSDTHVVVADHDDTVY